MRRKAFSPQNPIYLARETAAAGWRDKRLERLPPLERLLSEDEFQVAWESAVACGLADVVLADQPVGLTGRRLGAALLRTSTDLLTPQGWRRVAVDVPSALRQAPTFFGFAALLLLLREAIP